MNPKKILLSLVTLLTLIIIGNAKESDKDNQFDAFPVSDFSNNGLITGMNNLVKLFVPKSCEEWNKLGFDVTGYYLIDPDGKGVGEEPVHVYCDMLTGYTFIGHDKEGEREIEMCEGPGCNSVDIKYNITMKQIQALLYNSHSCHQTIKIDCLNSPLMSSWWEDRHGQRHEYWAGSQLGQHMCACGFTRTCVDPRYRCNCDSNLPNVWLHDEGALSDVSALPVTKLNFGMTSNIIGSKIKFTLGPLRCYGSKVSQYHESCEQLRWSGVTRSGYYFLGSPDNLTLTYCTMKNSFAQDPRGSAILPHQPVFDSFQGMPELLNRMKALETQVQQLELAVESGPQPVIFHSHASDHISQAIDAVEFDTVLVDTHNGYSTDTGKYIVPIKGTYLISFYSERQISDDNTMVRLKKNDDDFSFVRGDQGTNYSTFGLTTVNYFDKNDVVQVRLQKGQLYGCKYGCNGFSIVLLRKEY